MARTFAPILLVICGIWLFTFSALARPGGSPKCDTRTAEMNMKKGGMHKHANITENIYFSSSFYTTFMPIDVTIITKESYEGILLYLAPAANLSSRVGCWKITDCRVQHCKPCGEVSGLTHRLGQTFNKIETFQVLVNEYWGELVLNVIVVKKVQKGFHWDIHSNAARIRPGSEFGMISMNPQKKCLKEKLKHVMYK